MGEEEEEEDRRETLLTLEEPEGTLDADVDQSRNERSKTLNTALDDAADASRGTTIKVQVSGIGLHAIVGRTDPRGYGLIGLLRPIYSSTRAFPKSKMHLGVIFTNIKVQASNIGLHAIMGHI